MPVENLDKESLTGFFFLCTLCLLKLNPHFMLAVIETGGKQYLVRSGETIAIEKIDAEAGKAFVFDKILLTAKDDGSDAVVGSPYISGATIEAAVVSQGRTDKLRVVKYKRKVRYRRVHGHRQHVTTVTIK